MRRLIRNLTIGARQVGSLVLVLMMVLITAAVVARSLGSPFVGDIEIIQLMMVVAIMMALAYVESENAHVAIGLVADKFSPRLQAALGVLAGVLTVTVALIISWVNFGVAWAYLTVRPFSSDLLGIPLYPFKIIIGLGFLFWGLEAAVRLADNVRSVLTGKAAPGVGGSTHGG